MTTRELRSRIRACTGAALALAVGWSALITELAGALARADAIAIVAAALFIAGYVILTRLAWRRLFRPVITETRFQARQSPSRRRGSAVS